MTVPLRLSIIDGDRPTRTIAFEDFARLFAEGDIETPHRSGAARWHQTARMFAALVSNLLGGPHCGSPSKQNGVRQREAVTALSF